MPPSKNFPQKRKASAKQKIILGSLLAVTGTVFYLLLPMLTPFIAAFCFAYIFNRPVSWLAQYKIPRALGASLLLLSIFATLFALLFLFVPILQQETQLINTKLPALLKKLETSLSPDLKKWFGAHVKFDSASLQKMVRSQINENGQDWLSQSWNYVAASGSVVFGVVGNFILIPLLTFYLLLDWPRLSLKMHALVPPRWHQASHNLADEINQLLLHYIGGQLLVMIVLSIYYTTGLMLAGFESALPIGVLTGCLIFIPYVGFAIGLVFASLVAFLQFSPAYAIISLVLIFGIGQVLEGFFLTPRLVGERIGLHPVAVLFALLAFGQLWGFLGILIALPCSAVITVLLRHLVAWYRRSAFYV